MKAINVGIIGSRSLSSGALIKILVQHKYVNISMLVSEKGTYIHEEHPFLHGILEKKQEGYDPEKIIKNCDLVFLHKTHGQSFPPTAELIDLSKKMGKSVKFIDLSADFRLKDKSLYDEWYGFQHKQPKLLGQSVYGLTELYRGKIRDAILVANPGCYPTASLLALAPLFKAGIVDIRQGIIIDAVSGVSGAGKGSNGGKPALDVEQNIVPYKIGREHQHIPEIEQEITNISKKKVHVTFVPSVVSFKYGIFSKNYVTLKKPYEWSYIYSVYEEMYKDEPFIRILGKGKNRFPEVKDVEGTNFCDIGFDIGKITQRCVVISAIDNTIKGASGQAIQNMNVMYGIEETEGLPYSQALRKSASF